MKRLHLILLGCAIVAVLCNASGCKNKSATPVTTAPVTETTPAVIEEKPVEQVQPAGNIPAKFAENAQVRIKTAFGDMVVVLYNETPLHRDNFLKLVDQKYYDGLLFHRCIRNFMVQGGDPNSRGAAMSQMLGSGGPGYTTPAEFNAALIHKKGALCAARQGDQVNPKKESSGSQFYIVQGQPWNDMQLSQLEMNIGQKMPGFKYTEEQKQLYKTIGGTAQLDMDYTVFGEVVDGLAVVDSINAQPTARGDRPLKDVVMNMQVIKKAGK